MLATVDAAKEPDLGAGVDRVGIGRIHGQGVDHRIADAEARRPPRRAAVVAPLHAAAGQPGVDDRGLRRREGQRLHRRSIRRPDRTPSADGRDQGVPRGQTQQAQQDRGDRSTAL